jgi:hypothetical protein
MGLRENENAPEVTRCVLARSGRIVVLARASVRIAEMSMPITATMTIQPTANRMSDIGEPNQGRGTNTHSTMLAAIAAT